MVFDWCKATGLRPGDNPCDGLGKVLPKQPDVEEHHAALPYPEVPGFVVSLHKSPTTDEAIKLAFELLILTAARTAEIIYATWTEVDRDNAVWTIPASRMKAKQEHRVPLSPRCLAILKRAKQLAGEGKFLFLGRTAGKSLSNMAFLMTLRRMNVNITAHGFRSSFRDWAAEQTNFPREVCEMALAHTVKDKVEAAYRRTDLFDRRRELMTAWSAFVTIGER